MLEQRLRVAYFVPPSQHFAGIERVVHEIATGLMEAHSDRLDIHVVFASRYDEEVLANTNYKLHILDVNRLRYLGASLRTLVVQEDFDVLVCPQVEASVLGWLATRGLSLPVFITHLHGNPQIEEQEGSLRTRVAFKLFRHLISRRVSAVLAVSPSLRRFAETAVTCHSPVIYVKNPIRELGAVGTRTYAADGRFHFLSVGRLTHQKGQDILLRALALARADLPPVKLTLLGSGCDEAQLRELSTSLGLDDLVNFGGYVSDPSEYFLSADCLVLASRWEGFGMVLIEALHFGLPLVAVDCDFGPSDIITDVRIGELVPPENPEALAEGLRRAAASESCDPDETAFRQASAKSYSRVEAAKMHYNVLSQIIEAQPSREGRLSLFGTG